MDLHNYWSTKNRKKINCKNHRKKSMLSTDRCSHKKKENKYIHAPIMCEKKEEAMTGIA
jgi:hypothetical protein